MTPEIRNIEINRKFRAIRKKCYADQKDEYPAYCRRAVLDLLDLLNDIREENKDTKNSVDNLTYLNDVEPIEEP